MSRSSAENHCLKGLSDIRVAEGPGFTTDNDHSTILCLSFLTCPLGMTTVPTLQKAAMRAP